jgi:SET family sugar efflux transporter-like MFS transporter
MQSILVPLRTLLGHRDLTVVLVCNLLLGLAFSFVAPFYSMFGTMEVGMSNWTFGVFMTITSVAGIILSTVLARWSDTRYSRRAILLLGCVFGTVGYAGFAYIRSVLWLTIVGSIALGIASITFSQLFAYAREAIDRHGVPQEDAPLYMNIYRLALSLAWTTGPAIAAWVMIRYSFRGTFLICAAFFFLLMLIVWLFIPSRPPADVALASRIPLVRLLRRSDLLCYFSAFVLVFVCGTMGMMNLPLMILHTLGGSQQQVGIAYSVAPVFELPFMLLFGLLASRGRPGPLIRLGVIIAVAYYALLSQVKAPWHVYPVQILSAAMVAIVSGIAITFFQSYIPNQPGTATNLYTNANRIGSTVGYLCFGSLASGLGYRTVFVVCAGVCAAAFLLLWLSREQHEAEAASEAGMALPAE